LRPAIVPSTRLGSDGNSASKCRISPPGRGSDALTSGGELRAVMARPSPRAGIGDRRAKSS
jgi:hypothetical protein